MGRWVEIVGSSPPRKRLDSSLPDDPAEAAAGQARIQEMARLGQAPSPKVWNPSWSKLSLGYEVDSRAKWEAEKAKRGLVEFSPNESTIGKGRDIRGDLRQKARKAAEEALVAVKQGYRPEPVPAAPPPPRPAPPPVDDLPLEKIEALARNESMDVDRPHPGYVAPETLIADMKRRKGWM